MLNRSIFKIRVLVTGDDVCCFIKKLLLKEDEGTIRNKSENGGVFTQTWKFAAAQMGFCHVIFYHVCDLYINEKPEPPNNCKSLFCIWRRPLRWDFLQVASKPLAVEVGAHFGLAKDGQVSVLGPIKPCNDFRVRRPV